MLRYLPRKVVALIMQSVRTPRYGGRLIVISNGVAILQNGRGRSRCYRVRPITPRFDGRRLGNRIRRRMCIRGRDEYSRRVEYGKRALRVGLGNIRSPNGPLQLRRSDRP